MKLTIQQLRSIISEEVKRSMTEIYKFVPLPVNQGQWVTGYGRGKGKVLRVEKRAEWQAEGGGIVIVMFTDGSTAKVTFKEFARDYTVL